MASLQQSPPRGVSDQFVDPSGAPLPGASFPGSPASVDADDPDLSDIVNGENFAWEVNNVEIARTNGGRTNEDVDEDDNQHAGQDATEVLVPTEISGVINLVPDEEAEEEIKEVSPDDDDLLTPELACKLFRDMSASEYGKTRFTFGSSTNPVVSLQV